MIRYALVISCCVAPHIAFGDTASGATEPHDPVGLMFGVGFTQIGDTGYDNPAQGSSVESSTAVAFDALFVYRATARLGIGVRFSTASSTSYQVIDECGNLPGDCSYLTLSARPIDVGITAQYVYGRLWLAPWIGEHFTIVTGGFSGSSQTPDILMLGITGGVDLVGNSDYHVGLYVDYHQGTGDTRDRYGNEPLFGNWSAITVGLACRR